MIACDIITLAPARLRRPASPCVALRRCLRRCVALRRCLRRATLHKSGRDAAPRDAAPVRAKQRSPRRWPSQGKSGRRDAKSGQVRAMEKPRKSRVCAESGPQSGAGSVARTPHGGRSAGGRMILTPQQGVSLKFSAARKNRRTPKFLQKNFSGFSVVYEMIAVCAESSLTM